MNFGKQMLNKIILVNMIRKFFFDRVNGISNRHLNKLKYQKMCEIIYVNWCLKVRFQFELSRGKKFTRRTKIFKKLENLV